VFQEDVVSCDEAVMMIPIVVVVKIDISVYSTSSVHAFDASFSPFSLLSLSLDVAVVVAGSCFISACLLRWWETSAGLQRKCWP
jgi:hypothetical protein